MLFRSLRMAATGSIRRFMAENPSAFDPRKYLKASKDAMYGICKSRYEAFNTAGNASKMKPISLEDMTDRYESGSLDQVVK